MPTLFETNFRLIRNRWKSRLHNLNKSLAFCRSRSMSKLLIHLLKSLFILPLGGAALLAIGCSGKVSLDSGGSSVSITFPKAAEKSSQHGLAQGLSTGYDFSRSCYAVNVTGSGITSTTLSCSMPVADFQGFVGPGDSISINVPNGTARKLEVFSYLRASSSDPCPTSNAGFHGLDVTKISRVGQVDSFDTLVPVVNLTVDLVDPGTTTVVSQYSLPAVCTATSAGTPRTGQFVCSANESTGSTGKILRGHATFTPTAIASVTQKYIIKNLARTNSP